MSERSSRRGARPVVSVEGVCLWRRGGQTSPPIDWQIYDDQQWAVVGPNGSGKSGLMKAIGGRVPVAAGRIAYHLGSNGARPRDQIAYVAFESQSVALGQDSPFHQARWHSGIDQDALPVSDYLSERWVEGRNPYQVVEEQGPDGRPDRAAFAARKEAVVELLGLEALLSRNLWQVSNGERRKVLLARALLQSPRLLILDNPSAGLDAGFRDRLGQIIGRLMDDGVRIVLVSNGREDLPPGITHVLALGRDGVVAQGAREAVLGALAAPEQGEPEAAALSAAGEQPAEGKGGESPVVVRMRNVGVSYGGVRILDGIDWTVRQGERWALLGPNGAGKTTLLSLILGDNPHAYANDISLFGRRRGSGESIWEIKKRIGWVAPELHLYYPRQLPAFDVVCSGFFDSVGRYQRCSPEQRDGAMVWLERLGLSALGDEAFGGLSEGEQRMVLIARALVKQPALLVLDEPCQGLDAGNRDRVLEMVEALGGHLASSMIYVTHHRDALPAIISHVLRLEGGRVAGRQPADKFGPRRIVHG